MVHFPYKIVVPQRSPYLVSRQRLLQQLTMIAERRLITVSAPAGYGKTSLLVDFATSYGDCPICWYTLDRFDEDPWVFLGYLVATIRQQFPEAMAQSAAMLAGESRSSFATTAATVVRDIYAIERGFLLVIDDWHLVDHVVEIKEVIAQALLRCPNCRLMLASRIYPSIPDMMLLAARRQMSGYGEEDLRFTEHEISEVLSAEYHVAIGLEHARALADQSNGWIAGVLLACQATGPAAATMGVLDSRAERHIYGFLAEQVFDRLPPPLRAFLLNVSLLEDLTVEGCERLLDIEAGEVLPSLMRQHLFVSEVRPGVLRFHPLFREFLQEHYRRTLPKQFRATALRVAAGYAAQRQWIAAFDTAVVAADQSMARRIVATGGEELYQSGRLETLERWFAALALDELETPLLCLWARVSIDRAHGQKAHVLADLAEARMQQCDEVVVLLLRAQLARIGGRYGEALEITERIFGMPITPAQRATALRTTAIAHHRTGHHAEALAAFTTALEIERRRGDLYLVAELQNDLGVYYEHTGQPALAVEHFDLADAHWALIGNTGMRAMSLNGKGAVQLLMGQYHAAYTALQAALECAQEASLARYQATVHASLGDLYSALGLWPEAARAYEAGRSQGGTSFITSYLELADFRLLIRQRLFEQALVAWRHISEETWTGHPFAARVLSGMLAAGLRERAWAAQELEAARQVHDWVADPVGAIRLAVLEAMVASLSPDGQIKLVEALDRAVALARERGHEASLLVELLPLGQLTRQANAHGWAPAQTIEQELQQLRLVGQKLCLVPERVSRPILGVTSMGTEQIMVDGRAIGLKWQKAHELFLFLLTNPAGASSEQLTQAIWPELDDEGSRKTLKTAVHELRKHLPPGLIVSRMRQGYALNPEVVQLEFDVHQFLDSLKAAGKDPELMYHALSLYRGDFLPLAASDWIMGMRAELRERYVQAMREAAQYFEQDGAYLDALQLHQRLLREDDLDEASYAGIMRCQIAIGNRAAALTQYQLLRRKLDLELGLDISHSSEVDQLYRQILHAS